MNNSRTLLYFLHYYFRPFFKLMGKERRAQFIAPLVPEAWSWSGCGLCAGCQKALQDIEMLICNPCEFLLIRKVNEPYLWLHSISFLSLSTIFTALFFNSLFSTAIEKLKLPVAFFSIFFLFFSIHAAINYYKYRKR